MTDGMYNFMVPNERPDANSILQRLGESSKCLLTGDEENLTTIPVDFNPSNILPSNMARISKKFMEKAPVVLEYQFSFTSQEVVFTVNFKSIDSLYRHNKYLLETLPLDNVLEKNQADFLKTESYDNTFNGSNLVRVFEFLTENHVKGVDRVTVQDRFSLDWVSFQTYVIGVLERNKNKSNIIRPNFG